MPLSHIKYRDFQGSIPKEDIDGIDAGSKHLARLLNGRIENGFVQTGIDTSVVPPSLILKGYLDNGYDLVSARSFYHSSQGENTIYILWKESAAITARLIILLNDLLLDPDEQNDTVDYLEKPHNVNYNFANDQLKINLNCKARYSFSTDDVLLNLTLVYLRYYSYTSGLGSSYGREDGWYLTPRWLGWQWGANGMYDMYSPVSLDTTRFSFNGTYEPAGTDVDSYSFGGFVFYEGQVSPALPPGSPSLCLTTIGGIGTPSFQITSSKNPSRIKFDLYASRVTLDVRVFDNATGDEIYNIEKTFYTGRYWQPVSFDIPFVMNANIIITQVIKPDVRDEFFLDNLSLEYGYDTKFVIIGVYADGQRGLLGHGNGFNIDEPIKMQKTRIDWRMRGIEFYLLLDGEYRLIDYIRAVKGRTWEDQGAFLSAQILYDPQDDLVTNKYNLPATTRVDNQAEIYCEVTHKGRVYFVNGSNKVYQSHISQLSLQADSFPIDEQVGFGFFIPQEISVCKAIAVTPSNDLLILSEDRCAIYRIASASNSVLKTVNLLSGSIGISSVDSLIRTLDGAPATDGLMWCDNNGVYFYGGGVEPPINLIALTHENYWRQVPPRSKVFATGLYNALDREYWLFLDNIRVGTVATRFTPHTMVFEIPYRKVRTVDIKFDEVVKSTATSVLMKRGNEIKQLDYGKTSEFILETHYTAGETSVEFDKIMQYITMELVDRVPGGRLAVQVFIDNDVRIATYSFNTDERRMIYLAPLSVRFKKMKFIVTSPADNRIYKLSEIGCAYRLDATEPLGLHPTDIAPLGYGYDYSNNYGEAL
jgi:hypothetical protein